MTICVARMLQESGIFFGVRIYIFHTTPSLPLTPYQLLSVLALGFGQGLYALDAADGEVESSSAVRSIWWLIYDMAY